MTAFSVLLATLAALSLSVPADDGDAPGKSYAGFKITTKRADDAVTVWTEKDRTVVAVKSPFGISQAVLERLRDTWPKAIVLRLRLKGLSSFRASTGKMTLDAALSI